ncbi:MAG: hypothetical protein WA803_12140 [Steroidobacteraceae bacterium]
MNIGGCAFKEKWIALLLILPLPGLAAPDGADSAPAGYPTLPGASLAAALAHACEKHEQNPPTPAVDVYVCNRWAIDGLKSVTPLGAAYAAKKTLNLANSPEGEATLTRFLRVNAGIAEVPAESLAKNLIGRLRGKGAMGPLVFISVASAVVAGFELTEITDDRLPLPAGPSPSGPDKSPIHRTAVKLWISAGIGLIAALVYLFLRRRGLM